MNKSKKAAKQINEENDEFKKNQQLLENARMQLKEEFIGLDNIIDELVRQISSWFIFPELQEQPYVINLWGMTGVGKTALVSRLVALLGCEKSMAKYDMNSAIDEWSLQSSGLKKLESFSRRILCLDEFQHARTIVPPGTEKETSGKNIVWQLLDSGKLKEFRFSHFGVTLERLYQDLALLVKRGVKAKNGKVISNVGLFLDTIGVRRGDKEQKILFFPDAYLEYFSTQNDDSKSETRLDSRYLKAELRDKLNQMNEKETLEFIRKDLENYRNQKEIDLSNMLVFVMGNLDEAFRFSKDFNTEVDADEFYKLSLEINLLKVKEALKDRFRAEQIARLGNNHIIFPGINRASYERIINSELKKVCDKFLQEKNILLSFDQSVNELIYKDGVYPTLGTRPLFSTINQMIKSNLGSIYAPALKNGLASDRINVSIKQNQMSIDYFCAKQKVFTHKLPVITTKHELDKQKPDELQAVVAVHETGHAIAFTIIEKKLPTVICSRTSLPGSNGYVQHEIKKRICFSFSDIIKMAVCKLCGLAAERIVFGRKMQTLGAMSDIEEATDLMMKALSKGGMGPDKAHFSLDVKREMVVHQAKDPEEMVREYLRKSYKTALKLMRREKRLLLEVAEYLSENSFMKGEVFLEKYFNRYASKWSFEKFHEDKFSYKIHLTKQLEELRKSEHETINKIRLLDNKNNVECAA